MDREQAIEKLNDIRCHVKETSAEEQALVMAINALKAQLSQEGATSDLISRQATIEVIDKALSRTFAEPCGEMILKDVPSAQPEPHWIPCEDCERRCKRWGNLKTLRE